MDCSQRRITQSLADDNAASMDQPIPASSPPGPVRGSCVASAQGALALPPPPLGPVASLIACITACSESHEELKYCLETFDGRCPPDISVVAVFVFLDGCPDEEQQATNATFGALVSILNIHVAGAGANVTHEGGCRVYLGKVGSVKARLYVKGRGEFQRSKRRSIIAFYDILGERIASGVSEEPLAVLHMDADTGSAEPGRDNSKTSFGLQNVAKLLRIMKDSDELGALGTQVRVLHRTKNALSLMQSFDCNQTFGMLGGMSLSGRSTVCIGMTVMYRYRAMHVSTVEGVLPPMPAFSRTADRNLIDHVHLDMNEDQGLTTFVMRAGYTTRTSLVTPFYTFAPDNIAELLGQRRRWQAGFLVGLPYQVLGLPSPHLQLSKLRWLAALLMLVVYFNMLVMPGMLGFCLAFAFEQVYVELTLQDEAAGTFRRQAVFASCIWAFWLAFILSTLGHAPKKVRTRCQVFFMVASVATVTCAIAVAALFRIGQYFQVAMLAVTAAVGLLLTHNIREWPHRLQELLLYCVFICAIKPMITMYTVANIDSALWGTRSVGDVRSVSAGTITNSDAEIDTNPDGNDEAEVTHANRGNCCGDNAVMATELTFSRGDAVVASIAAEPDEEVAVPHKRLDFDAPGTSCISGCGRQAGDGIFTGEGHGRRGEEGKGKKRGGLSLKASKFIILVTWVVLNVGVTVAYLWWRLYILAVVGLFSQMVAMVVFVVAAWVEVRFQRRSALPPSEAPPTS